MTKRLISVQLAEGDLLHVFSHNIDGFFVGKKDVHGRDVDTYSIIVGGHFLTLKDEAEFDRVKQLALTV